MLNWLRKLICPKPSKCPPETICPEPMGELQAATAYFSSDSPAGQRNADEIIKGFLDRCESYVDIAVYSLTWGPIVDSIIKAHIRGVKVRVLVDKTQGKGRYSLVDRLADAGVEIILDRRSGSMHNKFMIGDGTAVISGSYNWTKNATTTNVENFIVVRLSHVINAFQEEFDFLWQHNLPD